MSRNSGRDHNSYGCFGTLFKTTGVEPGRANDENAGVPRRTRTKGTRRTFFGLGPARPQASRRSEPIISAPQPVDLSPPNSPRETWPIDHRSRYGAKNTTPASAPVWPRRNVEYTEETILRQRVSEHLQIRPQRSGSFSYLEELPGEAGLFLVQGERTPISSLGSIVEARWPGSSPLAADPAVPRFSSSTLGQSQYHWARSASTSDLLSRHTPPPTTRSRSQADGVRSSYSPFPREDELDVFRASPRLRGRERTDSDFSIPIIPPSPYMYNESPSRRHSPANSQSGRFTPQASELSFRPVSSTRFVQATTSTPSRIGPPETASPKATRLHPLSIPSTINSSAAGGGIEEDPSTHRLQSIRHFGLGELASNSVNADSNVHPSRTSVIPSHPYFHGQTNMSLPFPPSRDASMQYLSPISAESQSHLSSLVTPADSLTSLLPPPIGSTGLSPSILAKEIPDHSIQVRNASPTPSLVSLSDESEFGELLSFYTDQGDSDADRKGPVNAADNESSTITPHLVGPSLSSIPLESKDWTADILVIREAMTKANHSYSGVVEACLQSDEAFDHWLRHCQTQQDGEMLADAVLCTMQQILDQLRRRDVDGALQLLRRVMFKFSLKCGVIPSILFQGDVECLEHLPRYGGSFGDVFHGMLAGRAVALKRLRLFQLSDKDTYWKNMCREALLWRQLHHPYVLPFLGLGGDPSNGTIHMLSPWMENGSLSKYLEKNDAISNRLKRIWVCETASGLNYLHENGVVHGDLRGANILLDENNSVHLADFGLAKLADAGKSTMGISTWHGGAARWMPPEVLNGGRCTFAGDVYSFACVCLEIVTEQWPFPHLAKDAQVIACVTSENRPQWPETDDPDLSEVGLIVKQAWNGDPASRPNIKSLRDLLAI